ncbi:EAL domain-containing protein [Vibrio sp. T187]|uniref:bifunctional diguanylate cyclase/phosphodiesterase n=1 Tax=Vibrio TaxID=662 RepID=UPI0010C99CF3|nr:MULTISPECIES: EAL domain-containing protein [Vibrio]MBW3698549.1 EAL domain-containing protein [Vibrio sp. T187]
MQTSTFLAHTEELLASQLTARDWNRDHNYLVQLFSTQPAEIAQRFAHLLLVNLPNVTVIGQSATHLIRDNQLEASGTLVVISEFCESEITAAAQEFSHQPELDSHALVDALCLTQDSKAVISFSAQVDGRDYPIYSAFDHLANLLPVAGGLCKSNKHGCWVMLNENTYEQACVAVALHNPNLKVWTGAYSEWNPIGMKHRVTHAVGKRLYSLNNTPAYEVFKHYLADGQDLPFEQLKNFPLYRESGIKKGVSTALNILPDGSIEFDKEWQVGEETQFCYSHPSLTVEKVRHGAELLTMRQPESVMIYNCASRLDFLDGSTELKPFEGVTNTAGVYCMGELSLQGNKQEILHHSLTYLALRESHELPEFNRLQLNTELTVSPLLNLVRNAIVDLDTMNAEMEHKLHKQAQKLTDSYRYDTRTGLPNRIALKERLTKINAREHLLTLKLTNFNQVNEKYGYQVGDQLLMDLSTHFQGRLDMRLGSHASIGLYSIGVGEWAIIFTASTDSEFIKQQFVRFADAIEHINFEPYGLSDVDYLSVSLCGGLASRCDFMDDSGDDLLLKAIEARRYGVRNNTHITNAKDIQVSEEDRKEQLGWLSCVSRAILDQKIIAYSQPIVASHTHELVSQECLVRILEEDGSIISPGQFLPIIEDTHLYTRLSRHMIKNTLDYMADKQGAFSINLSPQDLLSDRTLEILESSISKLNDPSRLGLEVLESEQIKDYGRMIEVCNHFRSLGARIIVDDFGSGYSNIDEIIKLEPQIIKLDGSLIRNVDQDLKQRKIASQLVQLCQVFNAKTIAEFVHNQEVCSIVEQMGVDYLQGYHLGKPTRLY